MFPSKKKSCGCGFGHTRKSAFGKGADAFFSSTPVNTEPCLNLVYNNRVPLVRFGSAGKTRFGPMTVKKK